MILTSILRRHRYLLVIFTCIFFIDFKMDNWKVQKRFVDTRAETEDKNEIEYKLLNWLDQLKNDKHYGAM